MLHDPSPLALDLLLLSIRVLVGGFFLLYRFRWVYEPSNRTWFCPNRAAKLKGALADCGVNPGLASFVAVTEILAGLGLILGLCTMGSAVVLGIIMAYGHRCVVIPGIRKMQPVDILDTMRCWLMWPEPLYLIMCVWLLCTGPGRFSLDHILRGV